MSEEKAVYKTEFNYLNKAISEFEQLTRHQAKKGFKKYGMALDPYENGRDWLDMEAQELVDAWQYNRAMKDRMKLAISKIKFLSETYCDAGAHEEIKFWLDFMEGK